MKENVSEEIQIEVGRTYLRANGMPITITKYVFELLPFPYLTDERLPLSLYQPLRYSKDGRCRFLSLQQHNIVGGVATPIVDKKWRLAANTAFKLAIAANLIQTNNADTMPASYTDDQFDQWHESFLAAVYMSPNNPVKCNNCDWMGSEDDLALVVDDDGPAKACPHCKTDYYLTNYIQ